MLIEYFTGILLRATVYHIRAHKILTKIPTHVESLIGLGEVYSALGDTGNYDMYKLAIENFHNAITISQKENSSRRLRNKELADVHYSKGYAEVKLYESLTIIDLLRNKDKYALCISVFSKLTKIIAAY